MARNVSLTTLIDEVRQRADIENDPHITDLEITRYINQSAAHLHAMIAEMAPETLYTSSSITTVSGQKSYQIKNAAGSTTFYKLAHVEANIQGYWRSLQQWTFEKQTQYRNANTWGLQAMPISYRIEREDSIAFAPVPDGGYTVQLYWIPAFEDLVDPTDNFDGRDGWEEWIVLDAAIKCGIKDETDIRPLSAERERVEARIKAQYVSNDLDHPSSVRDTWNSYDGIWPWSVR